MVCLLNMTARRRGAPYVPSASDILRFQNAQEPNCAVLVTPVRRAALTSTEVSTLPLGSGKAWAAFLALLGNN